jgi:hypothetical protein
MTVQAALAQQVGRGRAATDPRRPGVLGCRSANGSSGTAMAPSDQHAGLVRTMRVVAGLQSATGACSQNGPLSVALVQVSLIVWRTSSFRGRTVRAWRPVDIFPSRNGCATPSRNRSSEHGSRNTCRPASRCSTASQLSCDSWQPTRCRRAHRRARKPGRRDSRDWPFAFRRCSGSVAKSMTGHLAVDLLHAGMRTARAWRSHWVSVPEGTARIRRHRSGRC